MNRRPWNSALLAFALLAGCLTVAPQAAIQEGAEIFPMPEKGITIPARGDGAMTVEDLVRAFGEASGEYVTWTSETAGLMRACTVGFDRELVVEPQDLYAVVESVLLINRFVLTDIRRVEPRMMVVSNLETAARNNLRQDARFVAEEDLPQYECHPALMVSTVLHLPNLDVRTLTNALRGLTSDPNTLNVTPVPESNSVIVTGFTGTVLGLTRMLRLMDESAAPQPAVVPPAAPPGGRRDTPPPDGH